MDDLKDGVLSKGFMPYMGKVLSLLHNGKFMERNIYKLESLDVSVMRNYLLSDLEEIKKVSPDERDKQLQKLFTKIYSFQPNFEGKTDREIKNTEQRLYADIVLTPGFLDDEVVHDFLMNRFQTSNKNITKHRCLTQLIECLDGLNEDSKEKFTYCFRSSSKFAQALLYNKRYFTDVLNDRKLSMFNKETLGQIFRFSSEYTIEAIVSKLLMDSDDRALFVISQMCEHVYKQVGHTSEFILSAASMLNINENENFKNILIDYYDRVVGGLENEDAFKEAIKEELPYEMRELLNMILDHSYNFTNRISVVGINTLEEFMEKVEEKRQQHHLNVFGEEGFQKFCDGTFTSLDFKKIEDKETLQNFKEAMLLNIYGISLNQANYFVSRYGKNIDSLGKSIIDSDKSTLEVLKSLVSITSVELDNSEGIKLLQDVYFKYVSEKGLNYQKKVNSSVILEGLLNRMYMNTYTPLLYRDLDKVMYVDDGVPVVDAGVEFSMIVTALNGTSKYFENGVNIASKWNTAFKDNSQGLCTSFINNENLGVISLSGPILGFSNIPSDALNTMGVTDIFSYATNFNLRMNYRNDKPFVVGSEMANETRYGYNEILIDRFLATDSEGKVKLQPDYVVFYKTQDNYKMSKRYVETLKTAKAFGIPIVVVDYDKIQLYERSSIKAMEEELFSKDDVDKDLLVGIMARYMNNISGCRTIHGPTALGGLKVPRYVEFPEKDLGRFIDQVVSKCESSLDEEKRHDWINALEKAYENERRKHMRAISINSYHCSIGSDIDDFNLITDYNLSERLTNLHMKYDGQVKEEDVTFNSGKIPSEVMVLTELANNLGFETNYSVDKVISNHGKKGYKITPRGNDNEEVSLEEKLIVAYLTDNFKDDLMGKMMDKPQDELRFGTLIAVMFKTINKVPLAERVEDSYLKDEVRNKGIDMEKVNTYITNLEKMDDRKYLGIFNNFIYQLSEDTSYSHLYLAEKFLEKKANIREEFKKLNDVMTNRDSEEKKQSRRVL